MSLFRPSRPILCSPARPSAHLDIVTPAGTLPPHRRVTSDKRLTLQPERQFPIRTALAVAGVGRAKVNRCIRSILSFLPAITVDLFLYSTIAPLASRNSMLWVPVRQLELFQFSRAAGENPIDKNSLPFCFVKIWTWPTGETGVITRSVPIIPPRVKPGP